jgi:hypothetical protein
VSIGQVPLTLFFCQDDLFEKAGQRYSSFQYPSNGFPVFLDTEKDSTPVRSVLDYSLHGATLHLGDSAACILGARSEYTLDSLLRVLLSMVLLPHRGFLLHAATVERDSRAYIFMGRSGAGKSTIAGLSPAGSSLTDEISLLRADASGWRAHGTPFWGEFRSGDRNCSLPVAGVFSLVQAAENRLEPLAPRDALKALLANVLFFSESREPREALLRLATECAGSLPFFKLFFRRDAGFWQVLP